MENENLRHLSDLELIAMRKMLHDVHDTVSVKEIDMELRRRQRHDHPEPQKDRQVANEL